MLYIYIYIYGRLTARDILRLIITKYRENEQIGRREFQASSISGASSSSSGAKALLTSRAIFKPGIESNALQHALAHAVTYIRTHVTRHIPRDQADTRLILTLCRIVARMNNVPLSLHAFLCFRHVAVRIRVV